MTTIQCPKCGRGVAVGAGVAMAQCFGCGSVVELFPVAKHETNDKTGSSFPWVAVVLGAFGVVFLFMVVAGLLYFVAGRSVSSPPVPATASLPEASSNSKPQATPEPIVASEEERQRAARVSAGNRDQIMTMYDQLTSTTDRKVMAPKGSVIRNRTEQMLEGIENREIMHIAVLLQVDEADVRAVIQVALADRWEETNRELESGN